MTIRRVPLDELHLDVANTNTHDGRNLAAIVASLRTFGQVEPLVVQKATGKVIGGNGRLEAMRSIGIAEADIVEVEADNVHAAALGIALNRTAKLSAFDDVALARTLEAIRSEPDFPLEATGFEDAEVGELLERIASQRAGVIDGDPGEVPEPRIDRAEELRDEWQTALGQLWSIPSPRTPGKDHRLLIGDSARAEDVARLMDGEAAQGAFTSPPYAEQRKEQYGGTPADKYVDWWDAIQANVRAHLQGDGSFFVNIKAHCEDGERSLYAMDLVLAMKRRWDWRYVDEFCWRNTRDGVPGGWSNRFKNAFEPVHHFATGNSVKFKVDEVSHESGDVFDYSPRNAKAGSGSGLLGAEKANGYRPGMARPSNVIELPAESGQGDHTAPFPVRLPEFFLKAFSDPGDLWHEPFCGSGTTIVAAEQAGRLCCGMELLPKYAAVILERLSEMGLEPRLID